MNFTKFESVNHYLSNENKPNWLHLQCTHYKCNSYKLLRIVYNAQHTDYYDAL